MPLDVNIAVLRKQGESLFEHFIFIRFAKLLKKEKPDAVVSFMWYANLVTILAKFLSGVKCGIVVSERTSIIPYEGWFVRFMRSLTIRFFYPKATKIIVNSRSMSLILSKMSNISASKIAIINNPIDIRNINHMSIEDVIHPWYQEKIPIIITIGRLSFEKGFSYLLRALHIVAADGISCRLVILGEGVEKQKLKRWVMKLGIDDKAIFLGFQKNPYKYLAHSTVFVLSSLYEGFPNVLLEALALGVPAIATRCPTGPEEIITNEVNGILVPPADERALADAIKRLLLDEDLRKRLGEAGKRRAEDFSIDKIIKQYEDVIENVCAESAVK